MTNGLRRPALSAWRDPPEAEASPTLTPTPGVTDLHPKHWGYLNP